MPNDNIFNLDDPKQKDFDKVDSIENDSEVWRENQNMAIDINSEEYRLMINDLSSRIKQNEKTSEPIQFHYRNTDGYEMVRDVTKKQANKLLKELTTRAEVLEGVPWSLRTYHNLIGKIIASIIIKVKYRDRSYKIAQDYINSNDFQQKYQKKESLDKEKPISINITQEKELEKKADKNIDITSIDKPSVETNKKSDFIDFTKPTEYPLEAVQNQITIYINKQAEKEEYKDLDEDKKYGRVYYNMVKRFPDIINFIKIEDYKKYKESALNGYLKAVEKDKQPLSKIIINLHEDLYKQVISNIDRNKSFKNIPEAILFTEEFRDVFKEYPDKQKNIILDKTIKKINEEIPEKAVIAETFKKYMLSDEISSDKIRLEGLKELGLEVNESEVETFTFNDNENDFDPNMEFSFDDTPDIGTIPSDDISYFDLSPETEEPVMPKVEDLDDVNNFLISEEELLDRVHNDPEYIYQLDEDLLTPAVFLEAALQDTSLGSFPAMENIYKSDKRDSFIEETNAIISNMSEEDQYLIYNNIKNLKITDDLFDVCDSEENTIHQKENGFEI